MDSDLVSALRAVIAAQGHHVCDAPATLQSYLGEACPGQAERVALLLRAQEARIPADLIWSKVAPRADLGNRLTARLETQYGLTEADAHWAVTSWMDALDVKVPRPRIKPVAQTVSQGTVSPVTSERATAPATPSPATSPGSESKTKAASNQVASKASSQSPAKQAATPQRSGLPSWAVGLIAVVFILGLGIALYISSGPPANATRAPGVVKLPPGYKPPVRVYRGHVTPRPVKPPS